MVVMEPSGLCDGEQVIVLALVLSFVVKRDSEIVDYEDAFGEMKTVDDVNVQGNKTQLLCADFASCLHCCKHEFSAGVSKLIFSTLFCHPPQKKIFFCSACGLTVIIFRHLGLVGYLYWLHVRRKQ